MKEPADAFTSVCRSAHARCGCGFGWSLLPSGCGPLPGQRGERQPLVTAPPAGEARHPKPSGGDRNSHRIEAHADLILTTYEQRPEIFLRELREELAGQGIQTSTSSLSRFFARHGITRKKGRRMQLSRSERT